MWWGKGSDKDSKAPPKEDASAAEPGKKSNAPQAAPFDPDKLPNREKLPPALQRIVDKQDKDENWYDEIVDG